jgi:hypothetical protein
MSDRIELSLQSLDNYKAKASWNSCVLAAKFIEVINDYSEQAIENLHSANDGYLKYLIIKGQKTILHIFMLILLYTNNDELALHHSQKASYLYIEFMGQIGQADNCYLGLSARDASLFVYKKTIFDINSNVRKDWVAGDKRTRGKIETIELMVKLYIALNERLIRYDHDESDIKERLGLLSKRSSNHRLIDMVIEMKHGVTQDIHITRLNLLTKAVEFYCETTLSNMEMLKSLRALFKRIVRSSTAPKVPTDHSVQTDLNIRSLLEKGDIAVAYQKLCLYTKQA